MFKKGSPFLPISIVLFIGAIACFVGSIYTMLFMNADVFLKISAGFAVIAICAAFVYVFRGYRKDEANYFKYFLYLYACALLTLAVSLTEISTIGRVDVGIVVVCFGLVIFTVASSNLGMKKSIIVWAIVMALSLLRFCLNIKSIIEIFKSVSTVGVMYFLYMISNLMLALIFGLIIAGKYIDKKNRGRQL